jgi:hypothetical protein
MFNQLSGATRLFPKVSRTPRRPPPCARRRLGSPGEPGLAGCSAIPRLSFISLLLRPVSTTFTGLTQPREGYAIAL